MKKYITIIVTLGCSLALFACQTIATSSGTEFPTVEASESIKNVPSETFTTIPSPSLVPHPVILNGNGAHYEIVLSIPAGNEELPYRGVDKPEMEISGPDAFGSFSNGDWAIADLIGNRIQIYDSKGEYLVPINLSALGILNIADLRISQDALFVLEINLGPPIRYWVHSISRQGKLISSIDIPEGYHLENGLTGLIIDCDGNILLEMGGGSSFYQLKGKEGNQILNERNASYICNGNSYRVAENAIGENAAILAGGMTLETSLSFGYGGLTILKVMPDGSLFVNRADVVSGVSIGRPIVVDDTVHYISANGQQLGVARIPVTERYYYILRNLSVGPDGNVYCLLPTPDSLEILRLNFYTSLNPLLPDASLPEVKEVNP